MYRPRDIQRNLHKFTPLSGIVTLGILLVRFVTTPAQGIPINRVAVLLSGLLVTLPSTTAVSLAVISMQQSPHWSGLAASQRWFECLLSIALIAVVPFALIVWFLQRNPLPRRPGIVGALAGHVSGSLSVIGYAIHCAENATRFDAVWYWGTIAIFTLAGAAIGSTLRVGGR